MKTAKVVEVRDLGPLTPLDRQNARDESRIDHMSTLLRLYPAIEAGQKADLLDFLKKGPQVEIGLLSAREGMPAQLIRFRRDHQSEFRLRPTEIAGFLALIMVPLLLLVGLCMN